MIAPRPHPPRRLPRSLPTPPAPNVPPNRLSEPKPQLVKIVYEEVLDALTVSRALDEIAAVAIALKVARRVVSRTYPDQAKV